MAFGALARATFNPTEADAYIAEGEAVFNQGSISQNYFWYRLGAMGLGLHRNGPEMVKHHAKALSTSIGDAPSAWATFHIQRCLSLSKVASGHANDAAKTKLSDLLKEAKTKIKPLPLKVSKSPYNKAKWRIKIIVAIV